MARKTTRTFRMYLRLLRRDIARSARRLIRTRRRRGQLTIVLTRPSLRTSNGYLKKWRAKRTSRASPWLGVGFAYTLLVVGFAAMGYGLIQLSDLQPAPPQVYAAARVARESTPQRPVGMQRSVPVRVSMPDVAIDTSLIQLGKRDDGTMETPAAYDVAGWYKHSPTPGEIGPSVITGHVDNYKGAAVFFRLKELQPGQRVMVAREDGSVATFAVTKVEQYDQDHFPTEAVYGNTPDAELRLITCGGPFNHFSGAYTQNTVVYAAVVHG